ncbi:MAG: 23S rRNA (uracil(1939)-C(5))-methyltransferase RlmD [Lachnospiraceae bacterium]|nr:23S rRNA (uracil(1939)-C(5))-methyltransferase RlmD [Lachnospiraceae bacterium]
MEINMYTQEVKECSYSKKCGGCQYIGMPYKEQLKKKQKKVNKLLDKHCEVKTILGMDNPYYYRNKVHAVFARTKKGQIISGTYEAGSHRVVNIDSCLIENQVADAIIRDIRELVKSFKIQIYNEDTGYGLLRHVLIRTGYVTGQVMVVLVLASPIMPSKNNFVKALRKLHPEITTVVLNVNDRHTNMVLGERDIVLYGKGYIEDILCGIKYRISPQSFYQINPVQTERLYKKAISLAGLTGKERVIDAYCGIGTIGMTAASSAAEVIGVELNKNAVRDAVNNAKSAGINNIRFVCQDAGEYMVKLANQGEKVDVVFMDPPRAGSDEKFLSSIVKLSPNKVVYVSCNPETLERDIRYLEKNGYAAESAWPVDMFPFSEHVETVCLLSRKAQ